ncbi:uncharacterized protein METZ01_LOCUS80114, partial [marine metagenome]
VIRERVRGSEVEHIGGQHQEAPEHQDVHATCDAIPQYPLLAQPADGELADSSEPRVEAVVLRPQHYQPSGLLHLV